MKELDKITLGTAPRKVFRSIEQYKRVRAAILSALSTSKGRQRKKRGEAGYLINRLVVNFTSGVSAEEIYIDYENGRVVLEAPLLTKDSKQSELDRRMYYYSSLIASVEAIATVAVTHIYLVLDDRGRKELDSGNLRRARGSR